MSGAAGCGFVWLAAVVVAGAVGVNWAPSANLCRPTLWPPPPLPRLAVCIVLLVVGRRLPPTENECELMGVALGPMLLPLLLLLLLVVNVREPKPDGAGTLKGAAFVAPPAKPLVGGPLQAPCAESTLRLSRVPAGGFAGVVRVWPLAKSDAGADELVAPD